MRGHSVAFSFHIVRTSLPVINTQKNEYVRYSGVYIYTVHELQLSFNFHGDPFPVFNLKNFLQVVYCMVLVRMR